jgi:hypothetical protein
MIVKIKRQTLKKLNGMMMVLVVPQIHQKLNMTPQIHPSSAKHIKKIKIEFYNSY